VARVVRKLEKFIDINFFIRDFEATCLPLMMAVQLQVSNISTENVLNRVSAGLGCFSLVYLLFVTTYLFRISWHSRTPMKPKDHKTFINKFSPIFEGFNLLTRLGSYSFFLLCLKKFALLYFLVFYQVVPEVQILCCTMIWFVNMVAALKWRSHIERKAMIVVRCGEVFMTIAHCLVFLYIYDIAQTI